MPPSRADSGGRLARLRRSADFARVQSGGRRLRSPHLLLLVTRGEALESRFGLAVSRKVGGAVQRNRVKRWLREAVRSVPPPRGGPWDLVLIPRPEALDVGFEALCLQVAQLFGKVAA